MVSWSSDGAVQMVFVLYLTSPSSSSSSFVRFQYSTAVCIYYQIPTFPSNLPGWGVRLQKSNALFRLQSTTDRSHRCGAYHHTRERIWKKQLAVVISPGPRRPSRSSLGPGEKRYFNTICPLGVHKTQQRIVKLFYSAAGGKRRRLNVCGSSM